MWCQHVLTAATALASLAPQELCGPSVLTFLLQREKHILEPAAFISMLKDCRQLCFGTIRVVSVAKM